jgi:elongation factor 1-beta
VCPVPNAERPVHLPEVRFLEADLRKKVPSIQDVGVEPIAFGLKALKIAVIVEDGEGGTEAVEEALASVPGVSQAETVCVNRMI